MRATDTNTAHIHANADLLRVHLPAENAQWLETMLEDWVNEPLTLASHVAPPDDQAPRPPDRETRREVKARVLDWHRQNEGLSPEHTSPLDLGGLFLTKLPGAAIGHLENLRAVKLNNNLLAALPRELEMLDHLHHLDLGHNCFTQLPSRIGKLQNLQVLLIGYNQLTGTLSAAIGDCWICGSWISRVTQESGFL